MSKLPISKNNARINVGTIGPISNSDDLVFFFTAHDAIENVDPLIIQADHGKRSKKGKRRKDWQT